MILAIETSCDETAVALYSTSLQYEAIASQDEIHSRFGGVVPELAAREHLAVLPKMVEQAVDRSAELGLPISHVAATRGPGLKGCLLIGYLFGHSFAVARGVPFMGINHLEGHILAPQLDHPDLEFPYLAILVSGGHSEVVEVRGVGQYRVITKTLDDAAGEAFDKSANLLGIPYPGGARLSRLAAEVSSSRFTLPVVMKNRREWSFSGLKTAVRTLIERESAANATAERSVRTEFGYISPQVQLEIAFAVEVAIVEAIKIKVVWSLRESGISNLAITGGVAANRRLRQMGEEVSGGRCWVPSVAHCTDNAAMIAYVAACRLALQPGEQRPTSCESDASSDLAAATPGVFSRWDLAEMRI